MNKKEFEQHIRDTISKYVDEWYKDWWQAQWDKAYESDPPDFGIRVTYNTKEEE